MLTRKLKLRNLFAESLVIDYLLVLDSMTKMNSYFLFLISFMMNHLHYMQEDGTSKLCFVILKLKSSTWNLLTLPIMTDFLAYLL